jgi:hypothetical protein
MNTINVLVIRDPDDWNQYITEDGVEINFITVDYGSGMSDRHPRSREEAYEAREMADSLEEERNKLDATSKIATELTGIIEELRSDADEILGPDAE